MNGFDKNPFFDVLSCHDITSFFHILETFMQNNMKEIDIRKKAFCVLVRFLRTEKKLTQEKLSILSGISRQHISEIETKGVIPSLLTQEALAKGLNITFPDFFTLFSKEYEKQKLFEKKGLTKEEYLKVADLSKKKQYDTNINETKKS